MTSASLKPAAIIRTERGLTIAGTRISLYDIIDLLKANYPPKYIRDTFNLSAEQLHAALSYMDANSVQVEAEYQEVLQTREEIRQYWEERNRDRFEQIAAAPPRPGYEAVRAKLQERRAQREASGQ
jgi:uncharacterized protein (DUF433 family)